MTKRVYWGSALAIAILPILVALIKVLLGTVAGLPLDVIELAISAILYSIPICFFFWLFLTGLSFLRGGWRSGTIASLGAAPLTLMYFVIILGADR